MAQSLASKFDYGIYLAPFFVQLVLLFVFVKQLRRHHKSHRGQIQADDSFRILRTSGLIVIICGLWFTFYWGFLFYLFEILNFDIKKYIFIGYTDILSILILAICILVFYLWRLNQSFRGSTLAISKTRTLRTFKVLIVVTSISWFIAWVGANNLNISFAWNFYVVGLGIAALIVLSICVLFVNKLIRLVVMQRHNLNFLTSTKSNGQRSRLESQTGHERDTNSNSPRGTHSGAPDIFTRKLSSATSPASMNNVFSAAASNSSLNNNNNNNNNYNAQSRKSTFDVQARQQPLIKVATKQTILLGFDFFAAILVGLSNYAVANTIWAWLITECMVIIVSITVWLSFIFAERQYMSICCLCHICCYDLCSELAVQAVMKRLIVDEAMIAQNNASNQHELVIAQSPSVDDATPNDQPNMNHNLSSNSINAIPEEDLPPHLPTDKRSIELAFDENVS